MCQVELALQGIVSLNALILWPIHVMISMRADVNAEVVSLNRDVLYCL